MQKGAKCRQLHINLISLHLFLSLSSCNVMNGQEIGDKAKWGVKHAGRCSEKHQFNVLVSRDKSLQNPLRDHLSRQLQAELLRQMGLVS